MTIFPSSFDGRFIQEEPKQMGGALVMPWFVVSGGFMILAASGFAEYGPTDWGFALATAVLAIIGGIRAMRTNSSAATKQAVKESVPPAIDQAIRASNFPTEPDEILAFAKMMAVEMKKLEAAEAADLLQKSQGQQRAAETEPPQPR